MATKQDLFIEIRKDLEARVKKDNFDVRSFTEHWLAHDLDGIATLTESAIASGVTLSTVGQVVSAAKIFEIIPANTPSPWAAMKSNTPDYSSMPVKELRSVAKDKGLTGVAKMREDDLVAALA